MDRKNKLSHLLFPFLCTVFLFILFSTKSFSQVDFEKDFKELFVKVQMSGIFEDSKTFPDCSPLSSPDQIYKKYLTQKDNVGFNLKTFVYQNFKLPITPTNTFKANPNTPVKEHIDLLWEVLQREPAVAQGSLIPLPNSYIVPGGRFREIYYWDSYFTMLGLQVSGKTNLIRSMVRNFAYLIDTVGFIPNGNRTYYLSRSQPPFFSLMVELLASIEGDSVLTEFLPQLEKEYDFWMNGKENLANGLNSYRRIVRMDDNVFLNRYWDDIARPRTESFKEDSLLAVSVKRDPHDLYRNIRAACESGWDFSSRWLRDGKNLGTIRTTELIPVDLNCLLYSLENTISKAYNLVGNKAKSKLFFSLSEKRKDALLKYCWDKERKYFFDYDFKEGKRTSIISLAAVYPLYFKIASNEQAKAVSKVVNEKLFLPGGVVTSLANTKEQWDYPNGWPPLQWITIRGLEKNGLDLLATKIKEKWVQNNIRVYKNTGKMMEKYNVTDLKLKAGGGEYPTQDGFGWTNGVLLNLMLEMD